MIRLYAAVIQQRWPYGSKQAVNMVFVFLFFLKVQHVKFGLIYNFHIGQS